MVAAVAKPFSFFDLGSTEPKNKTRALEPKPSIIPSQPDSIDLDARSSCRLYSVCLWRFGSLLIRQSFMDANKSLQLNGLII